MKRVELLDFMSYSKVELRWSSLVKNKYKYMLDNSKNSEIIRAERHLTCLDVDDLVSFNALRILSIKDIRGNLYAALEGQAKSFNFNTFEAFDMFMSKGGSMIEDYMQERHIKTGFFKENKAEQTVMADEDLSLEELEESFMEINIGEDVYGELTV